MIRNYLKIAWRNLRKNRIITFVNTIGLSIGVAACLLIGIYIRHEISYDAHIPDADRVFRVYATFNQDGEIDKGAHFTAILAPTLEQDFREVESAGRFMDNPLFYRAGSNDISIEGDDVQFREEGFTYMDQSLLDIIQPDMVFGTYQEALSKPKTIVLSVSKAKKYFGRNDPTGKVIYLNGNKDDPFVIGGVMKDFPTNSHLDYDFLITLTDVEFGEGEQTRWLQSNYLTYVKLHENVEVESFAKRMSDHIFSKYIVPALKDIGNVMAETIEQDAAIYLQPVRDIHLYASDIHDNHARGDVRYIWLFGIVALFILLIACINFINLSTAKSTNRAKEVGLRKVLGSARRELVQQFLTESVLITTISFLLGVGLSYLLLPSFNLISDRSLEIPFQSIAFIPSIIIVSLVVGVFAGIYPSLYLSGFSPISVLKGRIRRGSKSSGLRSGLVVFQFTVSIALIVGTIIINQQMNFILNKDAGFDKEQVLQLQSTNVLGDQVEVFKDEIKNIPGVVNASISDYLPIEGTKRNGNTVFNEGKASSEEGIFAQAWIIDEDYFETLGLNLMEGRNFAKDRATDDGKAIINQEMAHRLGMAQPVGQNFDRHGTPIEIIGVVEDFHFEAFTEEVGPLMMFSGVSSTMMSVKIRGEEVTSVIAALESKWNQFSPNLDFRYTFMDQSFAGMYAQVKRVSWMFTAFALLAIFIACLGLFALSAFIVEQRRKEMSIRKVLGASFESIFGLLTRQFVLLVFVSLLIAVPIATYFMNKWLEDYAYRIEISWHVFAIAGILSLLIALSTISYHALKTALVNPIHSLRDE